jgi:hypothetical protein
LDREKVSKATKYLKHQQDSLRVSKFCRYARNKRMRKHYFHLKRKMEKIVMLAMRRSWAHRVM